MSDTGRTHTWWYRDTAVTVFERQDRIEVRVPDGVAPGQRLLVLDTERMGDLLAALRDAWMGMREQRAMVMTLLEVDDADA
jgi:hypothetical protein